MSGKGKGKFSIIKMPRREGHYDARSKIMSFPWSNGRFSAPFLSGPLAGRTSQQFSDGSIRFIDWQEVDNKIIPRGIHTVFGDPGPEVNVPHVAASGSALNRTHKLTYQKLNVYDELGNKLPKSRIQVFHRDTVVDRGTGLVVYSKFNIPISHSFDDKPASIIFDTKGNIIFEAWFHNGVAIRKANPCYPQAILRSHRQRGTFLVPPDVFWTLYKPIDDMPNDSDYKKLPSPSERIDLVNNLGKNVVTRKETNCPGHREKRKEWMKGAVQSRRRQAFAKDVIKLQRKKGIETLKKHLRLRTAMKKTNKRLSKKFFSEIFSYL